MKSIFRALADRVTNVHGRTGNTWSLFSGLLGARQAIDWNQEAGLRWDNSAVHAAIAWMQRRMSEPRLIVERKGNQPEFVEDVSHPLPGLIENGPAYSGDVLMWGTLLSLIVIGDAYWYKVRSSSRQVVGFVLLDYSRTTPKNDKYFDPANPYNPVTYYEFRNPDGQVYDIAPSDVVHFRFGMNPLDHKRGLSPIYAALREIVGDNDASLLGTSLLRNGGVAGIAFEPKETMAGDITPDQMRSLEERARGRLVGSGAGTPLFMPFPGQFRVIGYEPDKLTLNQTRALAVSRILSGLGIDPMVLGFPSENKTYSNYAEANEAAVENCFLPLLKLIAKTITTQVLNVDFAQAGRTNYRVAWDLSEVRALQPDFDALWERVGKAWERNLLTLNEARNEMKLKDVEQGEVFYKDVATAPAEQDAQRSLMKDILDRARGRRVQD